MSANIRFHDTEDKFEADLQAFGGKKGCTSFMKFIKGHPWRNCNVSIYKEEIEPPRPGSSKGAEELDSSRVTAVITPSKEEKRIHGLVKFRGGLLTEIYSIFPINLNLAGQACQQIQVYVSYI